MPKKALETQGFLIHVSHYDPQWCDDKDSEAPFDPDVAVELLDAMAECGMNLLVVDCADGVLYRSHPELERHYSVPMSALEKLAAAAGERGIDVVPKLNFAKSGRNLHDQWMRPYSDQRSWLRGLDEYWKVAGDLIAELVEVCRPGRFFHIGMDEDHYRSLEQYVEAVKTLRRVIKKHRLRAVIWNDSCHFEKTAIAQVHADKCRAAEALLPRDVVQVLWDYGRAHPAVVKRIAKEGFEVWAAPGRSAEQVEKWKGALAAGGGKGLLMTNWTKCDRKNRAQLLEMVRTLGPGYC